MERSLTKKFACADDLDERPEAGVGGGGLVSVEEEGGKVGGQDGRVDVEWM